MLQPGNPPAAPPAPPGCTSEKRSARRCASAVQAAHALTRSSASACRVDGAGREGGCPQAVQQGT